MGDVESRVGVETWATWGMGLVKVLGRCWTCSFWGGLVAPDVMPPKKTWCDVHDCPCMYPWPWGERNEFEQPLGEKTREGCPFFRMVQEVSFAAEH